MIPSRFRKNFFDREYVVKVGSYYIQYYEIGSVDEHGDETELLIGFTDNLKEAQRFNVIPRNLSAALNADVMTVTDMRNNTGI
jgi:hypothetical protein